jgi:hypothetical protein
VYAVGGYVMNVTILGLLSCHIPQYIGKGVCTMLRLRMYVYPVGARMYLTVLYTETDVHLRTQLSKVISAYTYYIVII